MAQQWTQVQLRSYNGSELLFDEKETRDILRFFFPNDFRLIDSCMMTDQLRSFAQGLLIAAVDASYTMGWVQVLATSASNPGAGVKSVLKKLARNSTRYLLKSREKPSNLSDIKIYEDVRSTISVRFRSDLNIMLMAKTTTPRSITRALVFNTEVRANQRVWG